MKLSQALKKSHKVGVSLKNDKVSVNPKNVSVAKKDPQKLVNKLNNAVQKQDTTYMRRASTIMYEKNA